jgi:hypothetical protein
MEVVVVHGCRGKEHDLKSNSMLALAAGDQGLAAGENPLIG